MAGRNLEIFRFFVYNPDVPGMVVSCGSCPESEVGAALRRTRCSHRADHCRRAFVVPSPRLPRPPRTPYDES